MVGRRATRGGFYRENPEREKGHLGNTSKGGSGIQ
jgi:hypothetical protein